MGMLEMHQRKPDPGSPNVQTSPATDPAPDPRTKPIPPPQSSWKRLQIVQWVMLCILLLAITVGAAANVPVEEARNTDAAPVADPDTFHRSGTKEFEHAELCTNAEPCQTTTEPTTNICETPACKKLDSDVQDKMNLTMDPCDDFYNYACGGFIKKTPIPDGKVNANTKVKALLRMRDELTALISSREVRENDKLPFRLIKFLYQQCMIRPKFNPILSILEKLGNWTLLEKGGWAKPEPAWSLVKSVDDLRSQGYTNDYFIDFSVAEDWKNTSLSRIYIDQPTLGISRENLARGMNDTEVSAYFTSMINSTVLLGADNERAKEDLRHVLEFEILLAKNSLTHETRENAMTVQDLQSEYPFINWLDYFRVVFKDTGIVIDKNETVIVKAPTYFQRLGPLLQATSNRTLVNYVMWRVVEFSSSILRDNLVDQPQTKLSAEVEQDLLINCVAITQIYLPIAVAFQYVKEHANGDSRRATLEMAKELKNAFVDILKEADWMDNTVRSSCLEKVNSMVFHIGSPDELLDERKVVDYYKDLERKLWSSPSYLSTVLYIKQFDTMHALKMLRKAVNKTDWTTHSNQAEFFTLYCTNENSVQLSTGLLQASFLPHDLPRYMNYGIIGPVIGRLITKACNFEGRLWDKHGNSGNWWPVDTENAYLEKRECYIKQYNNYTEPNTKTKLRGHTAADTYIADQGGFKVAYRAYKKWAEKNGPEPRLPSLKLSPERMFWISAAQTFCSVYRPEAMVKHITKLNKTPDQFRVLGAMGNMVEFSEDFNCPSGSPMDRTEKCGIW